jgi:hypothetical protein
MNRNAPVAQLDRALPSEGKGHTFESCRVRHIYKYLDRSFPHPQCAGYQMATKPSKKVTQVRALDRLDDDFPGPDRSRNGTHPTSTVLSEAWYFAKRVTLNLALRSSGDAGRGFGRVGAATALVAG